MIHDVLKDFCQCWGAEFWSYEELALSLEKNSDVKIYFCMKGFHTLPSGAWNDMVEASSPSFQGREDDTLPSFQGREDDTLPSFQGRVSDRMESKNVLSILILQEHNDFWEILFIFTKKPYLKKGYAQNLLTSLCERAEEQSKSIFLEVRASNKPAQSLYKKFEFHLNRKRPKYYKDGEDALEYIRKPAVAN